MRDRILLLSWTVPPETSGSAVIVGNLAKQFTRAEMVVAGEQPVRRPAVAWKEEWPEIVYVTTGWPDTRRGARWWRKLQLPVLLLRCLGLVRKYRCASLLVVYPNQEYLLAGYLTSLITGATLFPYFHNTYLETSRSNSIAYTFARWLQSKVFARATHVFVMSEGMVELYRDRYPTVRCSALVHSFNEDIPGWNPLPRPGSPIRFVLSGNINRSCVDAAVRLCSAVSQVNSTLTILSGTSRTYLQTLGMLRDRDCHKTVSRDDLLKHLSEGDIVLLPHGFSGSSVDEEYRTIFPTRTIEYLICGRPILAHAPPDCFLTRFLRQHGCALVVDEPSKEAILAAIQRLCDDEELRATLVRNALKAAEMFRAPVVVGKLRTVLRDSEKMFSTTVCSEGDVPAR